MATPREALKKVREICLSLPGTREGDHFGEAAFYVKGRIFATCGGKHGACEIVVGLEPARAAALVASDPRFRPYPRDRRGVVLDAANVKGWDEVRALVLESYGLRKPAKARSKAPGKPTLLSGGNPQIAKADGDAAVQAYIAAMPGWKRDVGRRLDALVVRTVPGVKKAVRWNSPFYGIEGRGWFLDFHCITKYVKVAFFRGTSLRPVPPVESRKKGVRYLHIHEGDRIDEALVGSWIRQASELDGERCF